MGHRGSFGVTSDAGKYFWCLIFTSCDSYRSDICRNSTACLKLTTKNHVNHFLLSTEWLLSKFTYQHYGPQTASRLYSKMFQCALLRFPTHVHILWKKRHRFINRPIYSHSLEKCPPQKTMKTSDTDHPEADSAWSAGSVHWLLMEKLRRRSSWNQEKLISLVPHDLFSRKRDFVNVRGEKKRGKRKEKVHNLQESFWVFGCLDLNMTLKGSRRGLCAPWVCSAIWREVVVSKHC